MKNGLSIALIAIITCFYACKKENQKNEWRASIADYPTSSIAEIFKNKKPDELRNIIASRDEKKASIIIYEMANKIATYFFLNKKIDIRNDFVDNPEGIITLGLLYAYKESNNLSEITNNQYRTEALSSDMDCFLTAVGGVIGISDAKNIWKSIVAGASEDTVIGAVKLIGRRVATILTSAIMIYEVGSCLNWW